MMLVSLWIPAGGSDRSVRVVGKLTQTLKTFKTRALWRAIALIGAVLVLIGCEGRAWNNPYKAGEARQPVFFGSFSERPKHLDPARSYSSNEWAFISQVYEPPLQYHYLERPYTLVPLTAETLPVVRTIGHDGQILDNDAPASQVAFTDYILRIRPGILYQPHPALARDAEGELAYWPLAPEVLDDVEALADFEQTGTRELVADDYVYQIKRLAYRPNHSPVASLMAEHIRGFSGFSEAAEEARRVLEETEGEGAWLDLRDIPLRGVEVLDRYTYRIRIDNKYPQFRSGWR
jgi:oligopeptide transport system substrate-binding protein